MRDDGQDAVTQSLTQGAQELPLVDVVAHMVAEPQSATSLLRKDRIKEPGNIQQVFEIMI